MNLPQRIVTLQIQSTHPLPEATQRLQGLHKRGEGVLASRRNVLARVTPGEAGARVYLHRDSGRNLIAEVHGELQPTQGGSVLSGTASVHALTWYLPIVAGCLACVPLGLVALLGGPDGPPPILLLFGLPFAILGIVLIYTQSLRNRAFLVEQLRAALG